MRDSHAWMQPGDEAILEFLLDNPPEYAPLIAGGIGMHHTNVERRCRVLAESGLLETVSEEVVYRLTERGERFLATEASERAELGPEEQVGRDPGEAAGIGSV
ncbi:MarR family transcriptional regulator [Natronorarus salvus]|uniref:MarR family transcriptional regulator n=1 Tax=Natronorarus salvus TaxID=3117733 RepID=UPI002F26B35E